MIRTTIYLPDELHNNLKHLAIEFRRPMADLVREAVEAAYEQNLKDLQAARVGWKKYLKDPSKAIPAREYFAKRRK